MNGSNGQSEMVSGLALAVRESIMIMQRANPADEKVVIEGMRAAGDLCRLASELRKAASLAAQRWIEVTGVEPVDEERGVRYYVGQVTRVVQEANNQRAVVMLQSRWPELTEFAATLKSSPFKHGHIKKECRELFDAMYRVEIVDDLKTAKPKKELKSSLEEDHHARQQ